MLEFDLIILFGSRVLYRWVSAFSLRVFKLLLEGAFVKVKLKPLLKLVGVRVAEGELSEVGLKCLLANIISFWCLLLRHFYLGRVSCMGRAVMMVDGVVGVWVQLKGSNVNCC
jgi:hypothetical protein